MIYQVTAPLVVAKSHGKTVYRASGQRVDGLAEADAERLVRRGMIVATGESSTAAAVVDEDAAAAAIDAPVGDGADDKPKKTHSLERWQEYARSQGLSDADIADASKADLIALVG